MVRVRGQVGAETVRRWSVVIAPQDLAEIIHAQWKAARLDRRRGAATLHDLVSMIVFEYEDTEGFDAESFVNTALTGKAG